MNKICTKCGEEKTIGQFSGFSRTCLECEREGKKKAYHSKKANDPDRLKREVFRRNIKFKFGISTEQYDKMLIDQSGRCAICLTPMEKPDVDHDHRTKAVRGLLCHSCNTGLGYFCDSPELLRHAIEYLEKALSKEAIST